MQVTTIDRAQQELGKVAERVCDDHDILVIQKENGKNTVLMSLEDYNSIDETLYLLGSRKNVERLYRSIDRVRGGKSLSKELIEE